MFNPSTPVTGLAQTGLTSPTYTLSSDIAPDVNGKQYAVTALGGTQTGVTAHSSSSPFTNAMFRPKSFKALSAVNPVTGALKSVPRNSFKLITRKGVIPLAGQPAVNAMITTIIEVPAGSDVNDTLSLRAMLSCHFGVISQLSSELGNTIVTGIL